MGSARAVHSSAWSRLTSARGGIMIGGRRQKIGGKQHIRLSGYQSCILLLVIAERYDPYHIAPHLSPFFLILDIGCWILEIYPMYNFFRAKPTPAGSVIRIFRPETVIGWHRELERRKWTQVPVDRGGRSQINTELNELIVRLGQWTVPLTYILVGSSEKPVILSLTRISHSKQFADLPIRLADASNRRAAGLPSLPGHAHPPDCPVPRDHSPNQIAAFGVCH